MVKNIAIVSAILLAMTSLGTAQPWEPHRERGEHHERVRGHHYGWKPYHRHGYEWGWRRRHHWE
jgi:hypothetical protein